MAETEKQNGKTADLNQEETEKNAESNSEVKTKSDSEVKTRSSEVKVEKPAKEHKKRSEAVVNGRSVPVSTKYAIALCNFIRGKGVDEAISVLDPVIRMKKAVPMRGEIPHKKGIMSGRYPVNASKEFVKLLKSLKSNAIAGELEIEKYKIFCKADVANRPYRRAGRTRFKRTNILLKLIPLKGNSQKKSKNMKEKK